MNKKLKKILRLCYAAPDIAPRRQRRALTFQKSGSYDSGRNGSARIRGTAALRNPSPPRRNHRPTCLPPEPAANGMKKPEYGHSVPRSFTTMRAVPPSLLLPI